MSRFTEEELQEIQAQLEAEMHGSGITRFDKNNTRYIAAGTASDTAWNRKLIKSFVEPFAEAIQAYLDYYDGRRGKPANTLLYLRMLPTNVSAYVAIKMIFDALPQQGLSVQMLAERIGKRIEDQVRFTKLEEASPKYVKAIREGLKKASSRKYEHGHDVMAHGESTLIKQNEVLKAAAKGASLEAMQKAYGFDIPKLKRILRHSNPVDVEKWHAWPKNDLLQLGTRLIGIFAENVLYQDQPIIKKVVKDIGRGKQKSVVYIEPTEHIVQWVEEYKDAVSVLAPCFAPCVIPPRDWTSPTSGGYHSVEVSSRLPLVKVNDRAHLKRLTPKQMPAVYKAVNALQRVTWAVNRGVYEIANEVIDRDLALGFPSKEPIAVRPAPVPEQFHHLKKQELRQALSPEQWKEFTEWVREAAQTYDLERERQSKYLESSRSVEQAKKYKDFPALHFVYTLDFRGRVYAQSSLMSPQGSDLQKALIHHAKGFPLGKEGRYWLAVHGSGVWGNDKCSLDEMAAYTESMTEEILDYASNPSTFRGWAGADKPWQYLAFCLEWAALQEHIDAGNPEETFISRIACAQDGSCSGIQHYSAMLRDEVGGAAVNLVPSEQRKDIYGEVAEVALSHMLDICEGRETLDKIDEVVQKAIACAWIEVGIKRGLTKTPVMTLPYGSSQLTCRESIGDYLTDLQVKEDKKAKSESRAPVSVHPFSEDTEAVLNRFVAERLCSRVVWGSIGEVVIAARACMKYIKAVTAQVAKHNIPLEWVTPTGFIVHQAIYEMSSRVVDTQLMGYTQLTLLEPTTQLDVNKMKSACSPNFVHSMDASHLVLAVGAMEDAGLGHIAVIHDSFGTFAGQTAKLRKILVDTFADMYIQHDVLKEFHEYQEDRICEELEVPRPQPGNLDLEQVRKSKYAFA